MSNVDNFGTVNLSNPNLKNVDNFGIVDRAGRVSNVGAVGRLW